MHTELTKTYSSHRERENLLRIQQQEKLYDYYISDELKILKRLNDVLGITFDEDDVDEFQKEYVNITKKVINQLAIVYKEPAQRTIIKSGKPDEKLTKYLSSILPANVNTLDKIAHRYSKLFNTSLTRVNFRNGKVVYDVLPSYLFDVITDDNDPYMLTQVSYDKYIKNEDGDDELYTVFWTKDKHYMRQVLEVGDKYIYGDEVPIGNNGEMVNPYGVIPFAVMRMEMQGDFWGTGQCDLANVNEQLNFLLTDLTNGGIIMQSWGTPFLANTGLEEKNKKVRFGPKHPIAVKQTNSEFPPVFEYKNANPLIAEVRATIDWKIKMIALTKGLNPNSFLADAKAASGYSKIVDSLEQLEIRRDDIEPCRIYEDERFDITRAVVNYHAEFPENGLEKLPDDIYLAVDFADINIPQTTDEKIKENEFKLKNGLMSIIDIMKEQNPDLTDEEIEARLKKNLEVNSRLKG
ncbi:MAG: hypothetical protein EHM58_03285 [Ignavibacteriae bacterium]|nr:MAG: hypothetical protein EHM58_03285 [Ignavibacteriota bacterium]